MEQISTLLDLEPTAAYRRGEYQRISFMTNEKDIWIYDAAVPAKEHLTKHINALWSVLRVRKRAILGLKEMPMIEVNVLLGYSSDCQTAGLEIPPQSLEMFVELDIPFSLSIVVF
jgi:hypothetical protein